MFGGTGFLGLGGTGVNKAVTWTADKVGGAVEWAAGVPAGIVSYGEELGQDMTRAAQRAAQRSAESGARVKEQLSQFQAGRIGRQVGQTLYGLPIWLWLAIGGVILYLFMNPNK